MSSKGESFKSFAIKLNNNRNHFFFAINIQFVSFLAILPIFRQYAKNMPY